MISSIVIESMGMVCFFRDGVAYFLSESDVNNDHRTQSAPHQMAMQFCEDPPTPFLKPYNSRWDPPSQAPTLASPHCRGAHTLHDNRIH